MLRVCEELNRRGWSTKGRKKNGKRLSGKAWDKQALSFLLHNPIYRGKVRYRGEIHDGAHEAIIDEPTWRAVEHQLGAKAQRRGGGHRSDALLKGMVRCGRCGRAMATHYSRRKNRQFMYYVCTRYQKEGAKACPKSRVPVGDLDRFVVERIREIGKDPRLVREAIEAARRSVTERKPGLRKELEELDGKRSGLEAEKKHLVDAVAEGDKGTSALMPRLGGVEAELQKTLGRIDECRSELAVLERGTIDEQDLRAALASFEPVWQELFPAERTRILQLLIETVTYDSEAGEVAITFRPGGVRILAQDEARETA